MGTLISVRPRVLPLFLELVQGLRKTGIFNRKKKPSTLRNQNASQPPITQKILGRTPGVSDVNLFIVRSTLSSAKLSRSPN